MPRRRADFNRSRFGFREKLSRRFTQINIDQDSFAQRVDKPAEQASSIKPGASAPGSSGVMIISP